MKLSILCFLLAILAALMLYMSATADSGDDCTSSVRIGEPPTVVCKLYLAQVAR